MANYEYIVMLKKRVMKVQSARGFKTPYVLDVEEIYINAVDYISVVSIAINCKSCSGPDD